MARVMIDNDQLVIAVQGARKFFALKSEISIPLSNVESATIGLRWKELPKTLDKVMGTNANMFYYGGTFVQDGDKVFYDLKKSEDAVVIHLNDEKFKRLIIGVEDPDVTVKIIENALAKRRRS